MVRVRSALSPCPAYSNKVRLVAIDPGYSVSISLPSDSILCSGTSVKISAFTAKPGVTYQWRRNNIDIPGATSNFYLVTTSGYYRVMVSDGISSCRASSRSILFTVKPNPPAVISVPDGTTTACENEGVRLDANKGAFSYQWSRGGSEIFGWVDSSQIIKNSGVYSVKVRSADGCVSVSSDVTVNILPSPTPVISKSGFTLATGIPFASYEWIRNSSEVVGTSPTFNVSKKGIYKVRVTDLNGCVGESNLIEMMDQELSVTNSKLSNANIKIYPNPTSAIVLIEAPIKVKVSLKDVLGKLVITTSETNQLDLTNLSDGVYLITITDIDGNLIKQERINKVSEK
jgi:hypothetical protein